MKKRLLLLLAIVSISMSCISIPLAHPGRTDAYGGHWDHSTGEYHFHHGYPAHQHIDGVCPYDFDDQTNHSSGSSSGSSSGGSSTTTKGIPEDDDSDSDNKFDWVSAILGIAVFLWPLILEAIFSFLDKISALWASRKNRKNSSETNALPPPANLTPPAKSIVPNYRKTPIPQPKSNNLPIEQFIENTKLHYQEMYGGKSRNEIARLCGMPINVYISAENLPCSNDPAAQYSFYISSGGKSYHKKQGCSKAFRKVNAVSLSGYAPCKICKPVRPDLLWYYKYLDVLDHLRKYKIDIND